MSLVRVLRTTGVTLTRQIYIDETLTDLVSPPTVVTNRLDGTLVNSGTATRVSTGTYTYVLPGGPSSPGSATWQLDSLVATWSGTLVGSVVSLTDDIEIVGGFYFGLAEARNSDSSLSDVVKYTTANLAQKRIQVEQEAEEIMQRAWVPRFRRVLLDGTGRSEIALPDVDIRALRAASVAWITGDALTPLTGTSLTSITKTSAGTLVRQVGVPWPQGIGNVLVEYEYGMDQPPEELKQAAMTRLRSRLNVTRSSIPDRVSSYTTSDGVTANTFRLTQPGRGETGLPEVDAVYKRWAAAPGGFA